MNEVDLEAARVDTLDVLQTASQRLINYLVDHLRGHNPELLRQLNDACSTHEGGRLQISISPIPHFSAAVVLVRPGAEPQEIGRLVGGLESDTQVHGYINLPDKVANAIILLANPSYGALQLAELAGKCPVLHFRRTKSARTRQYRGLRRPPLCRGAPPGGAAPERGGTGHPGTGRL